MSAGLQQEYEEGKMFVGGLHGDTTKDSLKAYFKTFGEVADAIVMVDQYTNRSRGFGFVTFVDPASVAQVMSHSPHNLDNKVIDPKPAIKKNQTIPQPVLSKKVFVGGVPGEYNKDELRVLFSQFVDDITEIDVKVDPVTKRHRGFALITFGSEESVKKLLEMRYIKLDDGTRQVEVKKAEARKPGGSHRGGYTEQSYGQYGQYGGVFQGGSDYQQQYQGYGPGYSGYNSQNGGYANYSSAHPSGGYGAASYSSYPQSAGQQPVNSYQDQGYGSSGYSASRTDATNYGQQQYSAAAYQQQGYGNTPSGNTGYSGRGQQPQGGYGYSSHGMR